MDHMPQTAATSRKTSVLIILTMLALPALYVGIHPSQAQQVVSSGQAQAQSPASQLVDLERLAQNQPSFANRLNLSEAYIQNAQNGRAIALLTSLVAENPHDAIAWNNLCVAHTLQQEFNLAIEACQAGVRSDGSVQLLRNNLKWAEDESAKTLALLSEEARTPLSSRTSAFYLAEGLNHQHLGEYDEAVVAWKHCLDLDPANSAALNNIGMVQMFQHHYDDAETSFRRAVQLDPNSQLARNNLAWAMRR